MAGTALTSASDEPQLYCAGIEGLGMPESKSRSTGQFGSPGIDVLSIKYALLVADSLSFRQAAERLGVQQSAISRRVQALEDKLGVSLFERHHPGVRVTDPGARFCRQ
jgi:hypothetical protein